MTDYVREEDKLTEEEIKAVFFIDPNPDWKEPDLMTEEELREAVGDAAVDYALNM